MNITKLLKNKHFINTDQFYKRMILEKYILDVYSARIGRSIICFENEIIVKDKDRFFYMRKIKNRIKTLTVGKEYMIIDAFEGMVKMKNDRGHNRWFTCDRFLYSKKIERYEKLKKLNK